MNVYTAKRWQQGYEKLETTDKRNSEDLEQKGKMVNLQRMAALKGFVFHLHQTAANEAPISKARQVLSPRLCSWNRPLSKPMRHSGVVDGC